jgi:Alginate lyase
MKKEWLNLAKTALSSGNTTLRPALETLLKDADKALQTKPLSVTQKAINPPSGDKHDYMSFGPYWWPDPEKKDGRPYIRRDGEVNPQSREGGSDSPALGKLTSSVASLALAWHFTNDEKYAKHATLLLRTWFLNSETKMNPHLEYGQAIPGRVKGRGIGIIDTAGLLRVVDSVTILVSSKSLTPEDHAALKSWFRAYLTWLLTSKHGKTEGKERNNHGTWYDAQVVCFALFVGDGKTARKVLSCSKKRIRSQVDENGRQEHELARTKSFSYSIFNLTAMLRLATMAESQNIDLWNLKKGKEPALKSAIGFLAPYADQKKKWPHKQIDHLNSHALLPLLLQANHAYKTNAWNRFIKLLPEEERLQHRANLLCPARK